MLTITSETTFDRFRVMFNGIIQMSIKRNVLIFQSWVVDKTYYAIEVKVDGETEPTRYEYDSKEKLEGIINAMKDHGII